MNAPPLSPLEQPLQQLLMAHSEAPLLLALSGGLDSTLLLHLLAPLARQARVSLRAVHINHGLSSNAANWASHCWQVASELGVPCSVVELHLDPHQGNIEARAREARYAALKKELPSGGILLTAHHQDDQLETFLLALKRGAGVRGLRGMLPRQPFGQGALVRPWLQQSRSELEQAAKAMGIGWVEDESNQECRFERNFLRQKILPPLQQRWPSLGRMANQSMEVLQESEALLEEVAAEDLQRVMDIGAISIPKLGELSSARRNNLFRYWLRQARLNTTRAQLDILWHEVALAEADANPQLKIETQTVRRFQNRLYLTETELIPLNPLAPFTPPTSIKLPGELGYLTLVESQNGERLRPPNQGEVITIGFQVTAGTRLHPSGRAGSRSLKKLYQEYQVPPWQRGRIPILFYDDEVAAIAGLFITKPFVQTDGLGLSLQWERSPQMHSE